MAAVRRSAHSPVREISTTVARLRRVVLDRLIRYHRRVAELSARKPLRNITSAELGAALDIDASQVRKDFAAVGLSGVTRVGYDAWEVCGAISNALGFDDPYPAVLVGVGHLGGALLNYAGFDTYGLRIVAAFDSDPEKVGQQVSGFTVQSVHGLKSFIESNEIPLVILTTPAAVAQGLADLAVVAGAKAIWNFTPARLKVPRGVLARNEFLSGGLAQIAYHLHGMRPGHNGDGARADGPPPTEVAP